MKNQYLWYYLYFIFQNFVNTMFSRKPHLDLAKQYWQQLLKEGDLVIDATCGNGHDTLFLKQLIGPDGIIWGIDIQKQAIENTHIRLKNFFGDDELKNVHFVHSSHDCFPKNILINTISLIVYNLGYLPGGDKSITTIIDSTIASLEKSLLLLKLYGAVTITLYPGHEEGFKEQQAVLDWAKCLSKEQWTVCHTSWLNRPYSPSLLLIYRRL